MATNYKSSQATDYKAREWVVGGGRETVRAARDQRAERGEGEEPVGGDYGGRTLTHSDID